MRTPPPLPLPASNAAFRPFARGWTPDRILLLAASILGAIFFAGFVPALAARRFAADLGALATMADARIAYALAAAGAGFAACLATGWIAARRPGPRELGLVSGLACVIAIVALQHPLRTWLVDDAGITFAYANSLASGEGLRAQSWLAPEEGFSNLLWTVGLAGAARSGLDIAWTAKYVGIALGGAAAVLMLWTMAHLVSARRLPIALVAGASVLLTPPYIIWTASGLEHALQGFLLTGVACLSIIERRWWIPAGILLGIYVGIRPEAPLVCGFIGLAALWTWRRESASLKQMSGRMAFLATPALLVFAGVIAMRLSYFGDPLSNPYYAKAGDRSFLALLNPVDGGWSYIVTFVAGSGMLGWLALAAIGTLRRPSSHLVVPAFVLIGHLVFVIAAGGDWMREYRFLSPILPVLGLLVGVGVARVPLAPRTGFALASCMAFMVAMRSTESLITFRKLPTTPLSFVEHVGTRILDAAASLEIADPLLAHHDAGGIVYRPDELRLLDLAGLVNRDIAKMLDDPDRLAAFILDEHQPDFIFGTDGYFASAIIDMRNQPVFQEAYISLRFVDDPAMDVPICAVRRASIAGDLPADVALIDILPTGEIRIHRSREEVEGTRWSPGVARAAGVAGAPRTLARGGA